MFKNKFLILVIFTMALLSIGVASAQDSSLSNVTDTQDSVVSICDESMERLLLLVR